MAGKIAVFVGLLAIVFIANFGHVACTPAIGHAFVSQTLPANKKYSYDMFSATYDPLEVCIENCAQCKKMLGAWFEGPLCAESCIKFKGKLIPECEDFASISPFLNKL